MNKFFDLSGKVAVITGASSGLGMDAAIAYAEHGADVALLARRKDKLDEVAEKIKSLGKDVLAVQCDVSKEDSVKAAVKEVIDHYGKIDLLLNNAGIATAGTVEELTVDQWDKIMGVNVKGIYLMSKYVLPYMKEQKYGKIVNTSSINAIIGAKEEAASRHSYNTSKAAVKGLTMGMAASYMKYNITVNAVGPGLFESEMTENTLFSNQDYLNMYNKLCPASRPAKRGELNGTIIYLSSDASSYVTGQYILVDGGLSIV